MPTNLYGPGDNYHPLNSHVVPAMVRRFHEAKQAGADSVAVWGTGKPRREFLYVDDLAAACVDVMAMGRAVWDSVTGPGRQLLNVGYGSDVSIADLAATVAAVIGFKGRIQYDHGKPDGAPRKLIDTSRLASLGWKPKVDLTQGLSLAYADFLANSAALKAA